MQYTKSYGCPVLFLQDILLFDLTFLKFITMRKTQTKNMAETCFDTVKPFLIFHTKQIVSVKIKTMLTKVNT